MSTERATTRIDSFHVREHEALVLVGDFARLLEEFDLHALACGIQHEPLVRTLLGDGLTALALHMCTRPGDEFVGWTISLPETGVNLFFTGDVAEGRVIGRAFTEDIEPRDEGIFFAQVKRVGEDARTSTTPLPGASLDVFAMVEEFYRRSEQNPARFVHDGSRVALVVGLPGLDREWFDSLETPAIFALVDRAQEDEAGEGAVRYLATRSVVLYCGCDKAKVAKVLVGAYGSHPESLFGEDESVQVECPRCGASYGVSVDDYHEAS